jgi:hypothetical protein
MSGTRGLVPLAGLFLVASMAPAAAAQPPGSIQGTYWHDLNANGHQDRGEPGLAGKEIMLESHGLFLSTVTDKDGHYRFLDLTPDHYSVRAFPEPGWPQTWPPCGFYTAELPDAEGTITNLDFGSWESETPPSGRVPDGLTLPFASLQVEWDGQDVILSWGFSCLPLDSDYEIYEGRLGAFYSHAPIACTTHGVPSHIHTPPPADTYYLVVPTNKVYEGSYGLRGHGTERPPGAQACLPQRVGACPWAMPGH